MKIFNDADLNAKRRYFVGTTIQFTTPYFMAMPGVGRYDLSTGHVKYYESQKQNDGTAPCAVTMKIDHVHAGRNYSTPFIPANNISGKLRREAARLIFDHLASKGEFINNALYSVLKSGAPNGNLSKERPTPIEHYQASRHPYLGLFGGTSRMYRRNVRPFNAVPGLIQAELLVKAARGPFYDPQIDLNPELNNVLSAQLTRRVDNLEDDIDFDEVFAVIENAVSSLEERALAVKQERLERADQDKNDKTKGKERTSTNMPSAHEYVMAGTEFYTGFELIATPAQLGLFLAALDGFSKNVQIGGNTRNQYGQFVLNNTKIRAFTEFGHSDHDVFVDGNINVQNEMIGEAIEIWNAALGEMNASNLMEILCPKDKAPADKAKKSKKIKGDEVDAGEVVEDASIEDAA